MKFELSIHEINIILQSLGNGPYAQVFEIIEKIKRQAQSQIDNNYQTQIENLDNVDSVEN
jgi:hypothetical protein